MDFHEIWCIEIFWKLSRWLFMKFDPFFENLSRGIFMKFDALKFFENLSRWIFMKFDKLRFFFKTFREEIQVSLKYDKNR
jgi:hypothetical protein